MRNNNMLSYQRARKIGIDACIDKLGRDFVTRYRDSACSAYGDRGDHVYCFVGVSDKPFPEMKDELILTSDSNFPYTARCTVDYVGGEIKFLECVLPAMDQVG